MNTNSPFFYETLGSSYASRMTESTVDHELQINALDPLTGKQVFHCAYPVVVKQRPATP